MLLHVFIKPIPHYFWFKLVYWLEKYFNHGTIIRTEIASKKTLLQKSNKIKRTPRINILVVLKDKRRII